jgi:hypothetical protein
MTSAHTPGLQRAAQPYGLIDDVLDLRLDYEEVQIAVLAGLPPGVGAEQDHPAARWGGLQQAPSCLLDHGVVEHPWILRHPASAKSFAREVGGTLPHTFEPTLPDHPRVDEHMFRMLQSLIG